MFKLIDRGLTVKRGELKTITTPHGITINEFKDFFQRPGAFDRPAVQFTGGPLLELELTAIGYKKSFVSRGVKYGVNLNRIKNRQERWGLTIWTENVKDRPKPEPQASNDLFTFTNQTTKKNTDLYLEGFTPLETVDPETEKILKGLREQAIEILKKAKGLL